MNFANEPYIILVVAFVVSGFSIFIPRLAMRYAVWKNKKTGGEIPTADKRELDTCRFIGFVSCYVFSAISMMKIPLAKSFMNFLFFYLMYFGTYVDIKIRKIGNEFLKVLLVLALVYRLVFMGGLSSIPNGLIGLAAITGLFAGTGLIVYLSKGVRGVGMGDIKLAMIVGFISGWPGVLNTVYAMAAILIFNLIYIKFFIFNKKVLELTETFAMCFSIGFGLLYFLISGA